MERQGLIWKKEFSRSLESIINVKNITNFILIDMKIFLISTPKKLQ